MIDAAAHLCDDVLPAVPVRQWVLSLPFRIRYLLAYDRKLCSAVRRILVRGLLGSLAERAAARGVERSRSGAVVLAQRFGGALNLNLHFHVLVIDGTYAAHGSNPLAPPTFHEAAPLRDEDVVELCTLLRRRIVNYLRRLGRIPRDDHVEPDTPEPDEPLFAELCAASVLGRVALGPNPGSAVERLGRATRDERPRFLPGELCCEVDGFSLHAKVRIEGSDRDGLERLCRYVTRPPIQLERLSLRPDGRVVYALRRRWRDGTSAIVFEPLDFLARLAALVPRPRAHLLTYHGVLAPAAKWREFIVPRPESSTGSAGRTQAGSHGEQPRPSSEATLPGSARRPKRPTRSTWAELTLRAFAIDVLTCPHCGGLRGRGSHS